MTFTIREYRLGFAVWAAYRAAQAGSSKAKGIEFSAALKACGVVSYIDKYDGAEVSADSYKKKHDEWCEAVIKHIRDNYGKKITYGIAAKLLGVFVKGYFILAGNENKPLSRVAYPPIDSFVLRGVDKAKGTKLSKEYKWQKLNKNKYHELLEKLREQLGCDEELWRIEQYWDLG